MSDEPAVPAALANLDFWNELGEGKFPGHVGMRIVHVEVGLVRAELDVQPIHQAPNGFLHAAAVITLADTACGYGVRTCLPEGAKGFTTIELKSNFLGTALEGLIGVEASLVHGGKRTQVWDATVRAGAARAGADGRMLALFRCTQIVLW
jgi:1,4-dihydroxy-2-naphthoyl-CoA hydrolase